MDKVVNMEQLTGFIERTGMAYIKGYAEYLPAEVQMALIQAVVKRCWEYEATGWTPDQIHNGNSLIAEAIRTNDRLTGRRLHELLSAEAEGRLVVLDEKADMGPEGGC